MLKSAELANGSGFANMSYHNYSQFKKLLFGITPDNCFMSFLVNHRLHNANNTLPLINSISTYGGPAASSAGAGGGPTSSKQPNKQVLSKLNSPSTTQEPILINTHCTQYYGKAIGANYQY